MVFLRQKASTMEEEPNRQYLLSHQTNLLIMFCSDHSQVGSSVLGLRQKTEGFPRSSCNHRIQHSVCLMMHACSVVFDSLQPHKLQPTGLLRPWNFPGKNTAVGCHSYPKGSSQPRDWTRISCASCTGRWILYHEPPEKPYMRVILARGENKILK